jgi:hypothetical protein
MYELGGSSSHGASRSRRVATAVVAAPVALVGVLIGDGVLNFSMVEPPLLPVGESFALQYAVTAAGLGRAGAGSPAGGDGTPSPLVLHLVPSGWPRSSASSCPSPPTAPPAASWPRRGTNLVLGLCIVSLLSSVLARTTRVAGSTPAQGWMPDRGPYG